MSRPATTKTSFASSRGPSPAPADTNVLGASLRVRGRVTGEGDLRVEGEVEGDVSVSGALTIHSGAVVRGQAVARSVDVEGTLTGDISAEGAVALKNGARVVGDIKGSEVALDEGAAFSGRIDADFELPDDLDAASRAPVGVRPQALRTEAGRSHHTTRR